jgi:ABC-type transport system involved in cytochrome bd biosynthesis fused ATPase/permease subunit
MKIKSILIILAVIIILILLCVVLVKCLISQNKKIKTLESIITKRNTEISAFTEYIQKTGEINERKEQLKNKGKESISDVIAYNNSKLQNSSM